MPGFCGTREPMKKVAFLALLCVLCFAAPAGGETNATSTEEDAPLVPFAAPTLAHHLRVGLRSSYVAPLGHLALGVARRQRSGGGIGLGGDVGWGLDHQVVLGAYGNYLAFGGSGRCRGCSANGYSAGLFARYHLVQGLKFDPYLSYSAGLRGLSASHFGAKSGYTSIEWLRLAAGGCWYVSRHLGIGPHLELSTATAIARPSPEEPGGTNIRLHAGLRLSIDGAGRGKRR